MGGTAGKFIAVGIVVAARVDGVGLILQLAVEVDLAAAQMDAVAGNADDALDDKESGFGGRDKDNDVAAAGIAIGNDFVHEIGLGR